MNKNNERIEMPNEVHEWLMQYMEPERLAFPKCYDSPDDMWRTLAWRGLVRNLFRRRPEVEMLYYCAAVHLALSEELYTFVDPRTPRR